MALPPPIRPQRTTYKQPRRLNVVSIIMLILLGIAVYLAFYSWPVLVLRLRAKGAIEDMLPILYRANLRGEQYAISEIARIKKELTEKLVKEGVKDKKLEIVVQRSPKLVAIEAHFTALARYPGIEKTYLFHLTPRGETDATRVDW
jgi:hypothetical protein